MDEIAVGLNFYHFLLSFIGQLRPLTASRSQRFVDLIRLRGSTDSHNAIASHAEYFTPDSSPTGGELRLEDWRVDFRLFYVSESIAVRQPLVRWEILR